jgi:hypothetical protein
MSDDFDPRRLPPPGWSPTTEGFWRAAGRGALAVQVCRSCGAHRWPPTEVCYRCQSMDWDWADLPGTGRVFTYTWTDSPVSPRLAHLGVYNATVVELDGTVGEPVRMLSRVVDADKDTLHVDLPVAARFEPVGDGLALVAWEVRQ